MFKTQIDAILRLDAYSRESFRGVFAIDELSSIQQKEQQQQKEKQTNLSWIRNDIKGLFSPNSTTASFVVNYDESKEEGSHWVVVFRDDMKGQVEFFDSAGFPPLDDRIKLFLLGPNYSYNPNQFQQVLGNACGFYAVYFILQRSRKRSANKVLKQLECIKGDYFVKNYLYNQYRPTFS